MYMTCFHLSSVTQNTLFAWTILYALPINPSLPLKTGMDHVFPLFKIIQSNDFPALSLAMFTPIILFHTSFLGGIMTRRPNSEFEMLKMVLCLVPADPSGHTWAGTHLPNPAA